MNIDDRRQHVNRVVAGLGESGSHIPTAENQVEAASPPPSFAFNPEVAAPLVEADVEFNIPRGTPSLFEAAPNDSVEGRSEYPSPLNPQEVNHAPPPSSDEESPSLEDKFIQAVNNPEVSNQASELQSVAAIEPETQIVSAMASVSEPSGNEGVLQLDEGSNQSNAQHDHFPASAATTPTHGVEDAGFAATLMAERLRLKTQEQGAE